MKIKKILSQNRRDFEAIYICESCNHELKGCGYDDAYFHNEVIPNRKCPKCGKTSKDSETEYCPLQPKYPDSFQI